MAALTAPARVSAQHQSLLHFISQGDWSDEKVLSKVREMVVPEMERHGSIEAWIIGRDHARAQGIHAGEKGVTRGCAALHGHIVHEPCPFVTDAINIGRLPDHQTLMVNARLHPTDLVTHDEKDIGLLLLLRECWCSRHCHGSNECEQAD
jgi:hypothetical protein